MYRFKSEDYGNTSKFDGRENHVFQNGSCIGQVLLTMNLFALGWLVVFDHPKLDDHPLEICSLIFRIVGA